jgi:hypothetical protein
MPAIRLRGMSPVSAAFLPDLLPNEPTTWQGTTQTDMSGGWSIDLFRSILKYQGLSAA